MCLIIVKNKPDASFSVQDFRASWNRNSDGTGIMFVENGRVVVEKTDAKGIKEHLDLYYKHMAKDKFILHHRLATHGEKSLLNVHPFQVLNKDEGDEHDLWFVHNGVLNMNKFSDDHDKKLSDTHLFCNEYLRPLLKQFPSLIEHAVFQTMLHDFLGSTNKLAFLRSDNMVYVFNRQQGDEHNGCWLSNKYSIAQSHSNTYNYGRHHGRSNADYTAQDYYGDIYGETTYVEDNGIWRKEWNLANSRKNKASESMSKLSADEILESIDQYSGMKEADYIDLFESDPHLVFDMINFLEIGDVNISILNEKAVDIAHKLYECIQGYYKKKAA